MFASSQTLSFSRFYLYLLLLFSIHAAKCLCLPFPVYFRRVAAPAPPLLIIVRFLCLFPSSLQSSSADICSRTCVFSGAEQVKMNQAKKKKHLKNYLDLLPVPALAKIIFYLPETDRKYTIARMQEFIEAVRRHSDYLMTLSCKAYALLEKNKDLRKAKALVKKHSALLHPQFCKTVDKWAVNGTLETSTLEVAEMIHFSAKEIDPMCIVGKRMSWLSVEADESDYDNFDNEYDWKSSPREYVNVIWVRFGNIRVHYWFQPRHPVDAEDPDPFASFDLHVYQAITNEKLIYAGLTSHWDREDGMVEKDSYDSIGQFDYLEISDEMIILGTAIALAAGVGRIYHVKQMAHSVYKDTLYIVQPIADVLEHCGRNISTKPLAKSVESYISMLF